jgi:hypothetical protein
MHTVVLHTTQSAPRWQIAASTFAAIASWASAIVSRRDHREVNAPILVAYVVQRGPRHV